MAGPNLYIIYIYTYSRHICSSWWWDMSFYWDFPHLYPSNKLTLKPTLLNTAEGARDAGRVCEGVRSLRPLGRAVKAVLFFGVSEHTVHGRNPANQLRLVVYPIVYRNFWCGISSINSSTWKMMVGRLVSFPFWGPNVTFQGLCLFSTWLFRVSTLTPATEPRSVEFQGSTCLKWLVQGTYLVVPESQAFF